MALEASADPAVKVDGDVKRYSSESRVHERRHALRLRLHAVIEPRVQESPHRVATINNSRAAINHKISLKWRYAASRRPRVFHEIMTDEG
jgi:hypothetical protein